MNDESDRGEWQVTKSQPADESMYFPEYSIFIFTAFLQQKIAAHASNQQKHGQPLFVYASFQNVHGPLEAPRRFFDLYKSQVHTSPSR